MSNYAVIDNNTNLVVNIIVLDNLNDWTVPEGFSIIEAGGTTQIGWELIDGNLVDTSPPIVPDVLSLAEYRDRRKNEIAMKFQVEGMALDVTAAVMENMRLYALSKAAQIDGELDRTVILSIRDSAIAGLESRNLS